ncbi:GLPGLI family protein [Mucilaginibacter sp. ZT4R22]|uniref:GLPGLI family protein n=1 Tax=Mucilaginibacter pankratovii TaxID=2772110 RepID=A0ABR7WRR3_9SPHI|nr:GLPGLI family protein [Mucilaginibacter pankratovii]MBD1364990.1 GLPGLI family protein [Mucilaginibacter pankratovii]
MKSLFLLFTFGIIVFNAKAQSPEMAKATVRYKFSHIRDTTARDKPYTENMILFLGQSSSAYKSYDRKLQDALMKKQIEAQMAEQKGSGNVNIKVTGGKPTTRVEYYQFAATNKLVRKENLITPYLIEEPMPAIAWKVSADTASFGTLLCQKATGHFKGRDYTAWFCPDLPFRAGPWKLNGLPGLIVEAYDTNREVEFKFDGMEQVVPSDKPVEAAEPTPAPGTSVVRFGGPDDNADPNLIALPANAVKTSEKEFNKLQEAMRKDPQAFMAAMGGGGGAIRPATGGGPGGGDRMVRSVVVNNGSPAVINNPLELPEKK